MNPNLLNDVLRESDYPAFREELLQRVQSEARRKRRARTTRLLALAACLALIVGTLFLNRPQPKTIVTATTPVVAAKVEPTPLIPVIHTAPLKQTQVLETRSNPKLVLSTDSARRPRAISDSELMGLFPRSPVGFASTTTGEKRFIFANPAEAHFFMSSN